MVSSHVNRKTLLRRECLAARVCCVPVFQASASADISVAALKWLLVLVLRLDMHIQIKLFRKSLLASFVCTGQLPPIVDTSVIVRDVNMVTDLSVGGAYETTELAVGRVFEADVRL